MSRPKVYLSKYQSGRIRKAMLAALAAEKRLDAGQVQRLTVQRRRNKENGIYWMLAYGVVIDQFGNRDTIWILTSEDYLKEEIKRMKNKHKFKIKNNGKNIQKV